MDPPIDRQSAEAWRLAAKQHWVVTRWQLLALGFGPDAIRHRVSNGRLHPVSRGVYAVGRADLTRHGRWMAAVLSCGRNAALSHESAAALWEILESEGDAIHVSVPDRLPRHRQGVRVHRRSVLEPRDLRRRDNIPVTSPACTLVDLAACLDRRSLEAAINEADKQRLIGPETLRSELRRLAGRPGVAALQSTLDRATFALTDSELERRFLPIARSAGLSPPQTGRRLNGFKVDFFWPDIGLVVETDGLRYHRTPQQQARDRLRDQAHTATGLTPLRFTHAQVAYEPDHVRRTLIAVARRLGRTSDRMEPYSRS